MGIYFLAALKRTCHLPLSPCRYFLMDRGTYFFFLWSASIIQCFLLYMFVRQLTDNRVSKNLGPGHCVPSERSVKYTPHIHLYLSSISHISLIYIEVEDPPLMQSPLSTYGVSRMPPREGRVPLGGVFRWILCSGPLDPCGIVHLKPPLNFVLLPRTLVWHKILYLWVIPEHIWPIGRDHYELIRPLFNSQKRPFFLCSKKW